MRVIINKSAFRFCEGVKKNITGPIYLMRIKAVELKWANDEYEKKTAVADFSVSLIILPFI